MSTIKTEMAISVECPHNVRIVRVQSIRRRVVVFAAAVLLGPTSIVAACNSHDVQSGLRLHAGVENREVVAVLVNASNHSVKTVGLHTTAIAGSGGFYVLLHDASGVQVKHCAMINSSNPSEHLLGKNEKVVYNVTVASLTNQYCLQPGKYTGKVVYYNSLMFGEAAYSEPIVSGTFEIIVPNKS